MKVNFVRDLNKFWGTYTCPEISFALLIFSLNNCVLTQYFRILPITSKTGLALYSIAGIELLRYCSNEISFHLHNMKRTQKNMLSSLSLLSTFSTFYFFITAQTVFSRRSCDLSAVTALVLTPVCNIESTPGPPTQYKFLVRPLAITSAKRSHGCDVAHYAKKGTTTQAPHEQITDNIYLNGRVTVAHHNSCTQCTVTAPQTLTDVITSQTFPRNKQTSPNTKRSAVPATAPY